MLPLLFGLRSLGFFLDLQVDYPFTCGSFGRSSKSSTEKFQKKSEFHMEQHKTKHIYGVEIHNSKPTI
jgi:hypothetical protein